MITFCLTSCNRPDLLMKTLGSFLNVPDSEFIHRYIINDDSGVKGCLKEIELKYPQIEIYYNKERTGMMRNIDAVYSKVKTEYIFHCEDDWEFVKEGFILKSLSLLLKYEKLLTVWLRSHDDTNGHPVDDFIHDSAGVKYRMVNTGFMGIWHGYTTNPGLRRTKDVINFGNMIGDATGSGEEIVSEYYYKQGFRAALLEGGFIKHIGEGRTTMIKL